MLCVGGPIRYKIKEQFAAQVTDAWLFTHVCPHIRQRYVHDRRLCKVFATALLYGYCHLDLRQRLPEHVRIRIQGGLEGLGLDYGENIVEKIPLNIYQVSGNLIMEDMVGGDHGGGAGGGWQQQGNGGGGGQNHQLLQGILLQVGQTRQAVSLLHMHVDNQFQAMKTWQQRQNVLINSNIRRFGGTIQGAFARQDPQQAANRRNAAAQQEQQPAIVEDGTAELSPHPHTLMDLWHEWKFGLGNRKPAEHFTARERGGNGDKRKKQKYYRRNKVWQIMDRLVREGSTPQEACSKIRQAYGERLSVTQIINKVIKEGVHENLRGRAVPLRLPQPPPHQQPQQQGNPLLRQPQRLQPNQGNPTAGVQRQAGRERRHQTLEDFMRLHQPRAEPPPVAHMDAHGNTAATIRTTVGGARIIRRGDTERAEV